MRIDDYLKKGQPYLGYSLDEEIAERLQGVLIADAFEDRFKPLSTIRPCAKMPILGKALIEYSFELFIRSGVFNILIVLSKSTEEVSKFIKESQYYNKPNINFEIIILKSDYYSVGEALREIDRDFRSHLRGEFIVLTGYLVCNADIRDIIKRHLRRRLVDDRVVMTAVFNKYPVIYSAKDPMKDAIAACDSSKNEIMFISYHNDVKYRISGKIVKERKDLDIMYNLNYTGLFLFDIRALQLFSDNFDIQNVEDLIYQIVGDEILHKAVCYDIVDEGYLGMVNDLRRYYTVAFDALSRWAFPTTPKITVGSLNGLNLNIADEVDVDGSVALKNALFVGEHTFVSPTSVLDNSIICNDCYIGPHCTIKNSIIWSKVRIESNCVIRNSIICDGVVIFRHTEIDTGCMLCPGVRVGPNAVIPRRLIIYISNEARTDLASSTPMIDLGCAAKGSIFEVHDTERGYYDWAAPLLKMKNLVVQKPETPENSEGEEEEADPLEEVRSAVQETILSGIAENVALESIITELSVSKNIFNIPIETLYELIGETVAIFLFPKELTETNEIIDHVKKNTEVISTFCNEYFAREKSRYFLMHEIELSVYYTEKLKPLYSRVLLQLHCNDIITLDFLRLYQTSDFDDEDEFIEFRTKMIDNFIEWAEKNHLESDSEDEEEEDVEDCNNDNNREVHS